MKVIGMDLRVSNGGWIELYDPNSNELFCECFYNLSEVVHGNGFVAVLLKSGRLEVYNTKLQLIAAQLFQGIRSFSATEDIEVVFSTGNKQSFNRHLQPLMQEIN